MGRKLEKYLKVNSYDGVHYYVTIHHKDNYAGLSPCDSAGNVDSLYFSREVDAVEFANEMAKLLKFKVLAEVQLPIQVETKEVVNE